MVFPEGQQISEYSIKYLIKANKFCSSFRVSNSSGKSFFMKVFDTDLVPETLKEDDTILEIKYSFLIRHSNIQRLVDYGVFIFEGKRYDYMVTGFLYGRSLSESVDQGYRHSIQETISEISAIASALSYLRQSNLLHNDICPRNIIINYQSSDSGQPRLIDLGHVSEPVTGKPAFSIEDLNPLYCAPEVFNGVFSEQSDVFALAAVMYAMIYGKAPWEIKIDKGWTFSEVVKRVMDARKNKLSFPETKSEDFGPLVMLLQNALSLNISERSSLDSFRKSLGEMADLEGRYSNSGSNRIINKSGTLLGSNGGFADIAGMDDLKTELSNRVIWVLKDKERAHEYRLSPPNGMLLYGPPGCGKTYFAEKFAEETGYYYMMVYGSDIGSTLVHGTQTKIAELFKEAADNAPTVLCLDELDAFVPRRGTTGAEYKAEEINEFLAQLNNCSKKGIFVIGTTNRKDMIDPAVLRKGRLDLLYFIPTPDRLTRLAMFKFHLCGRPVSEDIDFDALAEATDGYASSDIFFVVNEAALVAALAYEKINHSHLINAIDSIRPSIKENKGDRRMIGFDRK